MLGDKIRIRLKAYDARVLDQSTGEILNDSRYRKVDISGDVIAYENCCRGEQAVRILRAGANGYGLEATLPYAGPSNWLSVVPDVVLLADQRKKAWSTFVRKDGIWTAGADIAAPDAVAGEFRQQPIASADRLAVKGDGAIWVLTISPAPAPK